MCYMPLQLLPLILIASSDFQLPELRLEPQLAVFNTFVEPNEEPELNEKTLGWGDEGTWRWGVHGGYAEELKNNENELILLGVEFDYFIANNLSLDIGLNLLNVTQIGDNTDGVNFTLQLRWHAIAKEKWSFFLEGGAGLMLTDNNVPQNGSDFNFTPQAGLGFSFDAGDQSRWLIGLRWHHISNANTHRTNPGRDSLMFWAGVSFPF